MRFYVYGCRVWMFLGEKSWGGVYFFQAGVMCRLGFQGSREGCIYGFFGFVWSGFQWREIQLCIEYSYGALGRVLVLGSGSWSESFFCEVQGFRLLNGLRRVLRFFSRVFSIRLGGGSDRGYNKNKGLFLGCSFGFLIYFGFNVIRAEV